MLVFAGFGTFLVDFWPFLQGFSQKRPKKYEKTCKKHAFLAFFMPLGAVRGFSRLFPDWFPTGSRRVPDSQNPVPI